MTAGLAGENRLVTVMFADMSGSVSTTGSLDAEDAAILVNQLLEEMVAATSEYGGRVDRFLGDGVLAVFGALSVHEDDAERAIRTALRIREQARKLGLAATAGINTGEVYFGTIGSALGLPRFDGQGWWLGQATCLRISWSVVSNSSGVL